jgi:hypothetical protein
MREAGIGKSDVAHSVSASRLLGWQMAEQCYVSLSGISSTPLSAEWCISFQGFEETTGKNNMQRDWTIHAATEKGSICGCEIQSFETGDLPSRHDLTTDVGYRYLRLSNGKTVEDATETLSPNTAGTLRSLK